MDDPFLDEESIGDISFPPSLRYFAILMLSSGTVLGTLAKITFQYLKIFRTGIAHRLSKSFKNNLRTLEHRLECSENESVKRRIRTLKKFKSLSGPVLGTSFKDA